MAQGDGCRASEAGGKIVIQLWHVGRISHTSLQPEARQPVAPSALAAGVKTFTANGFEDTSEPRALELDEMPRLVADYAHAAEMAKKAGFDGSRCMPPMATCWISS